MVAVEVDVELPVKVDEEVNVLVFVSGDLVGAVKVIAIKVDCVEKLFACLKLSVAVNSS